MSTGRWTGRKVGLAAAIAASLLLPAPARAAGGPGAPGHGQAAPAPRAAPVRRPRVRRTSPYRPTAMPNRGTLFYASAWGVDRLRVAETASGNLIRFSYRVVEPARAQALADRNATAYLVGLRSRAVLQIPMLEKVGPLRQGGPALLGQEYWMTFSNRGQPVKRGDRVNVVIGAFHAEGLVVE